MKNYFIFLLIFLFSITTCSKKTTSPDELLAPSNLQLTLVEENTVKLTWQDNSTDEKKFFIDRKKGEYAWFENYGEVDANITVFIDDIQTETDTVYSYRIRAFDGDDYSDYSIATGWFSECTTPSNLQLEQVADDCIRLKWQDNSLGELNFRIDRKVGNSEWQEDYKLLESNTTEYIDYQPSLHEASYYRVYSSSGNSHSQYIQDYIFANLSCINVPGFCTTIQEGINIATDGDTVLVQPGTYVENINFNGKNIIIASLFLITQDSSYISQTVIAGNQIGSVVSFENEEDTTTVLCGFTITNGYSYYSGGIYCSNSSPSLMNLAISSNTASEGAGIYCNNSSPILMNVTILGNTAYSSGAGIYCNNSSLNLVNVTITDNTAYYDNDEIRLSLYDFSVDKITTININNATRTVELSSFTTAYIEDTPVINWTTQSEDGNAGWNLYRGEYEEAFINGEAIQINPELIEGAGTTSEPTDYSFEDPYEVLPGQEYWYTLESVCYNGETEIHGSVSLLIPNLIGGGIHCIGSSLSLLNCILWYNSPQGIKISSSSVSVSYSDIDGGWTGEGNINSDPIFVDPGNDDFHLQPGSPCIDAGNPATQYNDPDGSINDMGAYGGPGGDW